MKTRLSLKLFSPLLDLYFATTRKAVSITYIAIIIVGAHSIGLNALSAAEPTTSVFQEFDLKHGIAIKLPKHWRIIESQVVRQWDTNTEVLTGVGQGNNDIVIAANYDDGRAGGAAATARVSVRTTQTITQTEVVAMSQANLDVMGNQGYQIAVSALSKSGHGNFQITPYRMTRESISGYVAIRADYQQISPVGKSNTSIYTIFLGSRSIKITLSYDADQASILLATITAIKSSILIKK